MPAALKTARTEKEEQLWIALKRQILRERQRKKEDSEREAREREREAREKQDEMTLGETRDQIQLFETKLEELRNDKKQLFLQLKKVLNEDDIRKRQLRKESSEMFGIHSMQTQPQTQLFLPPRTPHQQLIQKNSGPIGGQNQSLKRGRSPSPPQSYYKSGNSQSYSQPPKHEEQGRRMESNRAVLWNKPSQYTNSPGTLFYPNAPTNPPDSRSHPIIFSNYPNLNIPLRQNYHELPQQSASNQQSQQQQGLSQQTHKTIAQNQMNMEKMSERTSYLEERKDRQQPGQHMQDGIVYSPLRHHLPMHSNVLSLPPNQQQAKPTGSITQGYSRPQGQPQQPPVHYPRHRY